MSVGQKDNTPKVLITGVTGFVGSYIAETFAEAGYRVTGMLRTTSNPQFIEKLDIDLRYADITDRDSLNDAVAGHQYVIHPAGLIQAKSIDQFMSVNRDGTRNLLEAVATSCKSFKRFVYISSQAAAGPSDSMTPVTEDIPAHPVSDYGRSKRAGEEACEEYMAKLPITILRPPAVYGPRDSGVLPFFKLVKSGWYWKLGKVEPYASIVHVCDLARAVKLATESQKSSGETFFTANAETPSIWKMQRSIAEVLGVPVKPFFTPIWLAKVIAPIAKFFAKMVGQTPGLTTDKLRELEQRYWVCDSSKAEKIFGWRAEIPIELGLRSTADWYIENRWL
jgi:nucleoside-diphosphate-sugar epimerase